MSFRKELEAKYKKYQEEEQQTKKQQFENLERETKEQFMKCFGVYPDSVNGDFAIKDNITFHWTYNLNTIQWAIKSVCPKCGESCLSYHYSNKFNLLKQIFGEFEPNGHSCLSFENREKQTTEEKLIELFREFIYENAQQ